MWTAEDRSLLRVKWLQTLRRWKKLNLDSLVQAAGFLFLLALFWYLSFHVVARLCKAVYTIEVIGPIILTRIASFGFFAAMMVVIGGHVLTAYSSMYHGRELTRIFYSPYDLTRLYRIQSIETLILGGWVSGMFCLPILLAYGWQLRAIWWYYPLVIVGLGGFLITSGMIGILIMLLISRWIMGRPLRFALGSVVLIGGFVALVFYTATSSRLLLGNVDAAKLGESLANIRLSSAPYLPSQWMSELMNSARTSNLGRTAMYLFALWSSALLLWSLSRELGHRWFADAWLWAQEHSRLFGRRSESRRFRKRILLVTRFLPRHAGAIIYKEIHVFARDFSQWGQLVLILSLILFYVAHTQNMIFDSEDLQARNQLVFFNVILLGFIQATLSLRYTFPSISLEGKAYWTVASSGTAVDRFFFTKYYLHALVLLIIGESMAYMLNRILEVDSTLSLLSFIVLFLFSFGFTSWSMGFGAMFRKFEATSAADVTSDTGALVAMIVTLLYYGVSVAFLARFALDHTPGTDIVEHLALQKEMVPYLVIFLLIQSAAILFPVHYGLRSLQKVEF